MGKFGWTHVTDARKPGQGPDGSVQFAKGANGIISGSSTLIFNSGTSNLILSGNMDISGTITAHLFDVKQTTKEDITISGSTNFGDSSDDIHSFTGSVHILSGVLRQHYYHLTASSYTIQPYDSIIGVSSSAQVSINLQSAAAAGAGKILIIKDETIGTRSDANSIGITASGGQSIDNQSTYALSGDNPALTIFSNGTSKWFIY